MKKRITGLLIIALTAVSVTLTGSICSYAADEKVYFGSDEYEFDDYDEPADVSIYA